MRRTVFLATLSALAARPAAAQLTSGNRAVDLRLVRDEPDAVLRILYDVAAGREAGAAAWDALFASEGWRRLAERERSFKRPFDETSFRAFVLAPSLVARRAQLAATLAAWSTADVSECARRALAYLPAGSTLHAAVYPEIKPATNSFVYDLARDPGIFLYLDPAVTATNFTYTVAHELHHVGFAQNCPTPQVKAELAALPAVLRRFENWLGAFGEGFAVLAGAGGPDVDPASVVKSDAAPEWREERATFAPRMRALTDFFRGILRGELDDERARTAGMTFFGNQGAWYTVGWRMAVTIERRFGRPRLIACIADDRLFLPTYNAAAAGTDLPRWDDDLANAFTAR